MKWIWQLSDWPNFTFTSSEFLEFDRQFERNVGKIMGKITHLQENGKEDLKIEILVQEAISTSTIEGEILKRDSVQSSIRKHLGLKSDNRKVEPNASGIAEMMVDLYLNFNEVLSHDSLNLWHSMLSNGRRDIEIGKYRSHIEPMQIVSGNLNSPKVFFEAPPSNLVFQEMSTLIKWYNQQVFNENKISTLLLAGVLHLYFEIIHPFEDGNGRLGRALVEKAISQRIKYPSLNSFSRIIELNKKAYYSALQAYNHDLDIQKWLTFFSKMILDSQEYTINLVEFLILKSQFYTKFNEKLNSRQLKVITRVFDEGLEGFTGGLSAANYKSIAMTSPATTTRDLQELVSLKAMVKKGDLKSSRYFLQLN
jgi:Fic family protein